MKRPRSLLVRHDFVQLVALIIISTRMRTLAGVFDIFNGERLDLVRPTTFRLLAMHVQYWSSTF